MPIYGQITASEAYEFSHDSNFFKDLIARGHDPFWTWRYLRYRLNGEYKDELKLFGEMSLKPCFDTVVDFMEDEFPKADEDCQRDEYINNFLDKIYKTGSSFGNFPLRPYVGEWHPPQWLKARLGH